ncbi:MAG TPA: hypothetical protein VN873_18295 [Candidatus Angelobacter sp.]|nr:hypothetical protein [Candidatus Angelobacter sp.]
MKRSTKIFGFGVAALITIFFTAVYSISCMNAGQALSWEEFTNGLLGRSSNCGGNSGAVSCCREIALYAIGSSSNETFDFKHLSQETRDAMEASIGEYWTESAKYLLCTGPIQVGPGNRDLVVVCETAYGNVPQPTIWNLHHRTMRHAVGYSDGTVGWLTLAEFDALNKSNFVELEYKPRAAGSLTNNPFE